MSNWVVQQQQQQPAAAAMPTLWGANSTAKPAACPVSSGTWLAASSALPESARAWAAHGQWQVPLMPPAGLQWRPVGGMLPSRSSGGNSSSASSAGTAIPGASNSSSTSGSERAFQWAQTSVKPARRLLAAASDSPTSMLKAAAMSLRAGGQSGASSGIDGSTSGGSSGSSGGGAAVASTRWPHSWWPRPAPLSDEVAAFLKGLSILTLVNTLATMARAFSFAAAGMAAARSMHEQLLGSVLAAPLAFFDTQPGGRVLNRCVDSLLAECGAGVRVGQGAQHEHARPPPTHPHRHTQVLRWQGTCGWRRSLLCSPCY